MKIGTEIRSLQSLRFSQHVVAYKIYDFHQSSRITLLPQGNIEVVFQLKGDFYQRAVKRVVGQKRPKNFIGGLHSTAFEIENPFSASQLLSITFTPLGAKHFIPENLDRFKNELLELEDVLPQLKCTDLLGLTDAQLIHELDAALAKTYREREINNLELAMHYLQTSNGFMQVAELCSALKISRSYLRRIFNQGIGMSPKEYAKILRVDTATQILSSKNYESLTAVAYEMGYFDQAHFIKDFQGVVNMSPRKYAQQFAK